ncbi:MAG: 3-isopropylmalate dehydrogenase [Acidobacteria bacterium]|nr:3-isopropylmalate dehydrogenase [Acidobacteriota bacterium]
MKRTIVLLPGDGIGPEVISAAAAVLGDCAAEFGHEFSLAEFPIGGTALDCCGTPLPPDTLEACREADAILLGAVGGPRWDDLPLDRRPESGLLRLRKELELYINLRPILLRESLRSVSPLEPRRIRKVNFEIVRELAGGIYFGAHGTERTNGAERAYDVEGYSTPEVERVARFAFERAAARARRLSSVDKANVLASSVLWRTTVSRLAADYPQVALQHLYVDNAALQLVVDPQQFDVIVTSNLFGDILSDLAAGLVGSIGLIPSMSCGRGTPLFEPIHGSAPQLAGRDLACPIGALLSASLLLREAFHLETEARWIEAALDQVLARGYRTPDIAEPGNIVVGCTEFVARLRQELRQLVEQLDSYGWGV